MTVTVTINSSSGSTDITASLYAVLAAGTLTFIDSNTVIISIDANNVVTLNGSGFVESSGNLTTGTIDMIEVKESGSSVGTFDGFATDAFTYWNAVLDLQGGDSTSLDALVDSFMYVFEGNAAGDYFEGGDSGDILRGSGGSDTLSGGSSSDILSGGGGTADFLDGGAGSDFLSYGNSGAAVNVNLTASTASGGHATGDTFVSIEGVYGSAFDDTLTGSIRGERFRGRDGADTINGRGGFDEADFADSTGAVTAVFTSVGALLVTDDGFGNAEVYSNMEAVRGSENDDILTGNAGNERFRGLAGDDTLSGGSGTDLLDYRSDFGFGGSMGVVVNLKQPTATDGFGHTDTISEFEDVRGTNFGDSILGGVGANSLQGLDGNDTLKGGGGDDTLHGDLGNDSVFGQAGNDLLDGGDGDDLLNGAAGNDSITGGTGNDKLAGSTGNDTLTGQSGADTVNGGGGNDTLTGGSGIDRLVGGSGNDSLDGGTQDDRLISGSGNDTLIGGAGIDVLVAFTGDDTLSGGDGGDRLLAGVGVDTLNGGAGDDLLNGRADTVQDTFIFDRADWGKDRIRNFEDGIDIFDMTGSGVTSLTDFTISQLGDGSALIRLDADNFIRLFGTNIALVDSTDFLFDV